MQRKDIRLLLYDRSNSLYALFDFLYTGKEDQNATLWLLLYNMVC